MSKKESAVDTTPTKEIYDTLQRAFDYFNADLFAGQLPQTIITLQHEKKARGYFSAKRFVNLEDENARMDKVAMNPDCFRERTLEQTLSTLVHEMAHVWQFHFGAPARGRYHNKEWGTKMKSLGLYPSSTGEPGGKETGDKVSHYIIDGGIFAVSCAKLIESDIRLRWFALTLTDTDKAKKAPTRHKYCCPGCEAAIWGKPGLVIRCDDCDGLFLDQDAE